MRRLIPVLLCLVLPAAVIAGEKFYKWQDADGAWRYTTTPPPADRAAEVVEVDAREPPVPATAAPAAAAPASTAPTDPNARTDAEIKAARRASCEQARRNVQTLQNATTARMDLDRDGTPETLSAEQISAQLARARQQVQEYCSDSG